jgi:hypothetical protein
MSSATEDPKAPNQADLTRAFEAKDAELAAEQRKATQPKPHHFEVVPE